MNFRHARNKTLKLSAKASSVLSQLVPSSHHQERPLIEGWLHKNNKQRYFRLYNERLVYFVKKDSRSIKGVMVLTSGCRVRPVIYTSESESIGQSDFMVSNTTGKTWNLQVPISTESPEILKFWMLMLEKTIKKREDAPAGAIARPNSADISETAAEDALAKRLLAYKQSRSTKTARRGSHLAAVAGVTPASTPSEQMPAPLLSVAEAAELDSFVEGKELAPEMLAVGIKGMETMQLLDEEAEMQILEPLDTQLLERELFRIAEEQVECISDLREELEAKNFEIDRLERCVRDYMRLNIELEGKLTKQGKLKGGEGETSE